MWIKPFKGKRVRVYSSGLFFPLLASLFGPLLLVFSLLRFPLLRTRHNSFGRGVGGGMTGKRKMEETAVVSLTWLFIVVKPYCYVSLVVQSNLHTLVVLSFAGEFHTIFRLWQKELEKTEQASKTEQWIWIIFVKRLSGFSRWRIKKLCVYSAFKIYDLIKATHPRRPEEGSVIKYFEDNDSAG